MQINQKIYATYLCTQLYSFIVYIRIYLLHKLIYTLTSK